MRNITATLCIFLIVTGLCQGTVQSVGTDWSHSTDNISRSHRLVPRHDPHCNPANLDPLLPHGPFLCGFPNQDLYNAAARGVLDALQLALAALRVVARCGEEGEEASLTSYFDIGTPGVRDIVFSTFSGLVGSDGLGSTMMLDPDGYDLEIWYNQGSPDNVIFEHPFSCADGRLGGYMNAFITNERRAWIVICDRTFSEWRPTLDDVRCEDLDDVASLKMMTPGSVIVHEFMHWRRFTRTYMASDIGDWNSQGDPHADPPSGYGPYHAQILQEELKGAIYNADNYMWMALEAYFSEKCGREFGEQFEHDENNDHRADDNQISG